MLSSGFGVCRVQAQLSVKLSCLGEAFGALRHVWVWGIIRFRLSLFVLYPDYVDYN